MTDGGRRPKRVVLPVVTAAIALLALSSVVLAAQGMIAATTNADTTAKPKAPTVTVTEGAVVRTVRGTVANTPQQRWAIGPLSKVEPAVVTRDGLAPGSQAVAGAVIATVSERPTMILKGTVPAYRALGPGARGDDVTQVQAGLLDLGFSVKDKAGVYGASTAKAVHRLYTNRQRVPVDASGVETTTENSADTVIPFGELRFVSSLPVSTTKRCGTAGEVPASELCTLISVATRPTIAIAAADASKVAPGQKVTLELDDGRRLSGTLGEAIAPGQRSAAADAPSAALSEADAGSAAGPDEATRSFDVALADGASIAATGEVGSARIVTGESSATDLKVEAIAVQSSGDDTWLTTPSRRRVTVSVGICAEGFCAVTSPKLAAGTTVTIPGFGNTPQRPR